MLLAVTSEAVMCLSFAFMQLTLCWQPPEAETTACLRESPWVERSSHPAQRAFPCCGDIFQQCTQGVLKLSDCRCSLNTHLCGLQTMPSWYFWLTKCLRWFYIVQIVIIQQRSADTTFSLIKIIAGCCDFIRMFCDFRCFGRCELPPALLPHVSLWRKISTKCQCKCLNLSSCTVVSITWDEGNGHSQ